MNDLMQMLASQRGPEPKAGKYISALGVEGITDAVGKFVAIAGSLAGLNREEFSRFVDALPQWPSDANGLSRLHWLIWIEKELSMVQNVVRAEIKKMEGQ